MGPFRVRIDGLRRPLSEFSAGEILRLYLRGNHPLTRAPYRRARQWLTERPWRRLLSLVGGLRRRAGLPLTPRILQADVRVERFRLHAQYQPGPVRTPTVFFNPSGTPSDAAATWRPYLPRSVHRPRHARPTRRGLRGRGTGRGPATPRGRPLAAPCPGHERVAARLGDRAVLQSPAVPPGVHRGAAGAGRRGGPVEILMVDNRSTDGSAAVVAAVSAADAAAGGDAGRLRGAQRRHPRGAGAAGGLHRRRLRHRPRLAAGGVRGHARSRRRRS